MATAQPPHGSRSRYRAGCRCKKCAQWKAGDNARYRSGKPDAASGEASAPTVGKPSNRARPHGPQQAAPSAGPRPKPTGNDPLARLIEDALWDERGNPWAANVAADRVRAAGYRVWLDGPIEAAARAALTPSDDPAVQLRHEMVFAGAKVLDDADNARFWASTINAMRALLADLIQAEPDGGDRARLLREALGSIRGSRGRGDRPAVDDPEEP